jgi:hypothetical protein
MRKIWDKGFLLIILFLITGTAIGQHNSRQSRITVVSYLLRDRAVVIDSMVLRKCMYVAFKIGHSLTEVKGDAVTGTLSNNGIVLARDTTWLFDKAAGNLGFNLPYEIPEGVYRLEIQIINPAGKILETFIGEYDRADLKPYFNREIQFWDFTTPYAHLECSGYGIITYHFNNNKSFSGLKGIVVTARMNSDNDLPGLTEVLLNGTSLGKFKLPAGDPAKAIVKWQIENPEILNAITLRKGENELSFVMKPETGSDGMGMRIFSHKNSTDQSIGGEIPITLTINSGSPLQKTTFPISVWGEEGEHITSKFTIPVPDKFVQVTSTGDQSSLQISHGDVNQGYVVFTRNFQRNVYPWTIPGDSERINNLKMRMSRNDFEPVTVGIYPIRDLGKVKVIVSDLSGPTGKTIPSENVLIEIARIMKIRTGEGTNYRLIPRLLERRDQTEIPLSYTTRFWLTVHTDSFTIPGIYKGAIQIIAENENAKAIPFTVEVLPVTLEPVPDIDYSMLLSYEFFELESKEWSSSQKEKIYQDGVSSFRDYLNHGMSTVVVSSPYYFQWNKDGTPQMEHYNAMIRAAIELGITRPVFWYFGHYVQAAKGQHPGNIRLYDPKIDPKRARLLTETALKTTSILNGPPVYFMPVDEPRIALRQRITLELFREIKKVPGAKIMCTTNIGGELLDIENDSQVDRVTLAPGEKSRKSTRKVWEYNNTAIESPNPCYSRYIYGYYTWRQDLDGMNSWGPGTTENSRGDPYEDLDHEYSDYAITYPHAGGPLATPNWEALREGIDDIRYIYQLEKLCLNKIGTYPEQVARAEKFLDEIRSKCDFDDRSIINEYGDWTPEEFDSIRSQIIDWIIKLQKTD